MSRSGWDFQGGAGKEPDSPESRALDAHLPSLAPAPLNIMVRLESQQSFSLMRALGNGARRLAVKWKHWIVQMATNSSHPLHLGLCRVNLQLLPCGEGVCGSLLELVGRLNRVRRLSCCGEVRAQAGEVEVTETGH